MKILITGATGFIGRVLVEALKNTHRITVLTRSIEKAQQTLGDGIIFCNSLDAWVNLDEFSVVINLAGEPIADKRWSAQRKQEICASRFDLTQKIVDKINLGSNPPQLLINASAIGYYGRQDDTVIDEAFNDFYPEFSHDVCTKWEEIARSAQNPVTRVCILRLGIVLGAQGGALARMLPPYQFGLGGPLGSGEQWMSWIHRDDVVAMILFLMEHDKLSGIFNATAPNPVRNKDFSRTLAQTLKRPHLFFVPSFMLRFMFGEMADLLLYGQRVVPQRFQASDFTFKYPVLEDALQAILS